MWQSYPMESTFDSQGRMKTKPMPGQAGNALAPGHFYPQCGCLGGKEYADGTGSVTTTCGHLFAGDKEKIGDSESQAGLIQHGRRREAGRLSEGTVKTGDRLDRVGPLAHLSQPDLHDLGQGDTSLRKGNMGKVES